MQREIHKHSTRGWEVLKWTRTKWRRWRRGHRAFDPSRMPHADDKFEDTHINNDWSPENASRHHINPDGRCPPLSDFTLTTVFFVYYVEWNGSCPLGLLAAKYENNTRMLVRCPTRRSKLGKFLGTFLRRRYTQGFLLVVVEVARIARTFALRMERGVHLRETTASMYFWELNVNGWRKVSIATGDIAKCSHILGRRPCMTT